MASNVEDLFGEEVEVDQNAVVQPSQTNGTARTASQEDSLSEDDDLFGDGQVDQPVAEAEAEASDEEQPVEEVIETNFSVPNFKQPVGDDGSVYLAKLPSFLDISAQPYDADVLLAEIQATTEQTTDNEEKITKKRSLLNTIRWRMESAADGTEAKTSNARFVKWSDGSMSLQVGEELFDVPVKNVSKEHNYLTLMHADEGFLRSMQRFSYSLTFQPFGLTSKSHAELKADIARRAISSKGRSVKLHTELIDPADFQKQAIKADNERQKARRRLDNQKARSMNHVGGTRDRTQLTARYLDDSDEELNTGRQRYADENDDGFIEDDEEEDGEDARGSRLQALKDAGAAKYKQPKRSRADSGDELSEDESIEYEEDAGELSEAEAEMTPPRDKAPVSDEPKPKKLKRRIADSDDDEDG